MEIAKLTRAIETCKHLHRNEYSHRRFCGLFSAFAALLRRMPWLYSCFARVRVAKFRAVSSRSRLLLSERKCCHGMAMLERQKSMQGNAKVKKKKERSFL